MATRLGNFDFGLGLDISNFLRGFSQATQRLGSLTALQSRFNRQAENQAIVSIRAQQAAAREFARQLNEKRRGLIDDLRLNRDRIKDEQELVKGIRDASAAQIRGYRDRLRGVKDSIEAEQELLSVIKTNAGVEQRNFGLQLTNVKERLQAEQLLLTTLRRQGEATRLIREEEIKERKLQVAQLAEKFPGSRSIAIQNAEEMRSIRVLEAQNALINNRQKTRELERQNAVDLLSTEQKNLQLLSDKSKTTAAANIADQQAKITALNLERQNIRAAIDRNRLAREEAIANQQGNIAALNADRRRLRGELENNADKRKAAADTLRGLRAEEARTREIQRQNEALERQQGIQKAILDSIIATASAFATSKIFNLVYDSTLLAGRVENLGTILNNVGQIAGYNESQLASLEERIRSLGITTQAARQSLSVLALNEQDLAQSATLARIAQDAAAIAAINSSEAFEKLVVAIQRLDTRMLRQLGIVVNLRQLYAQYALETGKTAETLSATEKQQILLNEVLQRGANIAGTYEASLQDAFKQLTSLDRLTEEASRTFGENFLPIFEDIISAISAFVGEDDNSGLRGILASYGPLIAGASAFAVSLGVVTTAATSAAVAMQFLGASGLSVAGGLATMARAAGSLLATFTLANPVIALMSAAVVAGTTAYVAYQASVRKANEENERFIKTVRQRAQSLFEVKQAAGVIKELGQFSERTAEQQVQLANAIQKVATLLPEYSARIKAVRNDYAAILDIIDKATGKINQNVEELTAQRASAEAELSALVGGGRKFSPEFRDFVPRTQQDVLKDIRDTVSDLTLRAGEAAEKLQDLSDPVEFRFSPTPTKIIDLVVRLRELNEQIGGLLDAQTASRLQNLDRVFEGQEIAAADVLKISKDFDKERLELIKDTNFEIIKDYEKLSKALATVYLTEEQIVERRNIILERERKRILQNYSKAVADAEAAAKGTAPDSPEAKALRDILNRQNSALLDAEQLADQEADRARKQLENRATLEAEAQKFLDVRLEKQAKSIALLEKETQLENLRAFGVKEFIEAETKLAELAQTRNQYNDDYLKILGELNKRKGILAKQDSTESQAEADRIGQRIEQITRIRDSQNREFEAQEAALRDSLRRSREEATKEVGYFITDTASKLSVAFTSTGTLKKIPDSFKNLAKRVGEARQEIRKTTDEFIEQLRKAQSPEQANQISKLFGENFKQQRKEARNTLQELIKARDSLAFENLTPEEYFKRRDALDDQIREQRLFISEQDKLQKEQKTRVEQELANSLKAIDIQKELLSTVMQRAQQERQILEDVRERIALEERLSVTPRVFLSHIPPSAIEMRSQVRRLSVTVGGRRAGFGGVVSEEERKRVRPVTEINQGSISPSKPQTFGPNDFIGSANVPLVDRGLPTLAQVEQLDAFIKNAGADAARLISAIQASGLRTSEVLELVSDTYSRLADETLSNQQRINRVEERLRTTDQAFTAALSSKGLAR